VIFKHRLVINNVTADELGVYYCMKTGTPPKLSHSTRLHFTGEFIYSFSDQDIDAFMCHLLPSLFPFFPESTQLTECLNHTVVEFIDQNQNHTQWQSIIIISGLMNGLLLIVLIGE